MTAFRCASAARLSGAVALLTFAVLTTACGGTPPTPEQAIARGLGCVAAAWDGTGFDDPYLAFELPGENLPGPPSGERVTTRTLGAFFVLRQLRDAGAEPGPARALFDHAAELTAALALRWREVGISNLRRGADPAGVELGTYAALARLERDVAMAEVVAAGRDGDGWLPGDDYSGDRSHRRVEDELWAVRALAAAGVDRAGAAEVLARLLAETEERLARERDPEVRASLTANALTALAEARPEGRRAVGEDLQLAAARLLEEPVLRQENLLPAELISAMLADGFADGLAAAPTAGDVREAVGEAVDGLLERQGRDGCWSVGPDEPRALGRIEATLHVLLALERWQDRSTR